MPTALPPIMGLENLFLEPALSEAWLKPNSLDLSNWMGLVVDFMVTLF